MQEATIWKRHTTEPVLNRVQVVLSGFSVRLFCFVQANVGMVVCRCEGDVICVGHDLNRCSGWW